MTAVGSGVVATTAIVWAAAAKATGPLALMPGGTIDEDARPPPARGRRVDA